MKLTIRKIGSNRIRQKPFKMIKFDFKIKVMNI